MRAVGTIGKPHGVRGEVFVRTDAPELFVPGSVFDVGSNTLTVASARVHGDRFLVSFERISDRNRAEELRGGRIMADADPLLAEDEYLVEDLLGRRVKIVGSDEVATIVDVITSSPQHRLVLEVAGRRREVPFHPAIVVDESGELSVDAPAGLLD